MSSVLKRIADLAERDSAATPQLRFARVIEAEYAQACTNNAVLRSSLHLARNMELDEMASLRLALLTSLEALSGSENRMLSYLQNHSQPVLVNKGV